MYRRFILQPLVFCTLKETFVRYFGILYAGDLYIVYMYSINIHITITSGVLRGYNMFLGRKSLT